MEDALVIELPCAERLSHEHTAQIAGFHVNVAQVDRGLRAAQIRPGGLERVIEKFVLRLIVGKRGELVPIAPP